MRRLSLVQQRQKEPGKDGTLSEHQISGVSQSSTDTDSHKVQALGAETMGLTPQKSHIIDLYRKEIDTEREIQRLIAEQKPIHDRRTLGAIRDDSRSRIQHLKRCIEWLQED